MSISSVGRSDPCALSLALAGWSSPSSLRRAQSSASDAADGGASDFRRIYAVELLRVSRVVLGSGDGAGRRKRRPARHRPADRLLEPVPAARLHVVSRRDDHREGDRRRRRDEARRLRDGQARGRTTTAAAPPAGSGSRSRTTPTVASTILWRGVVAPAGETYAESGDRRLQRVPHPGRRQRLRLGLGAPALELLTLRRLTSAAPASARRRQQSSREAGRQRRAFSGPRRP